MADSLEIAIRAEESAKSAHDRLNRMNGSIDRLTGEVAKTNATAVEILRRMDREEGREQGESHIERGVLDNRRFLITMTITVLTSSLVALLLTLALRGGTL